MVERVLDNCLAYRELLGNHTFRYRPDFLTRIPQPVSISNFILIDKRAWLLF